MDLAIVFFMGFFALPWMWMGALMFLFVIDVVLTESECFGWATFLLILGTSLVAWLGGDVNVFAWTWANLAEIAKFLIFYFAAGGVWSVVKWYFYLLKVRDRLERDIDRWQRIRDVLVNPGHPDTAPKPTRPHDSFAKDNPERIMGWIAHWPFSMIGSLIGDVLTRAVRSIYEVLRGAYDRIGNHVFAEFDK